MARKALVLALVVLVAASFAGCAKGPAQPKTLIIANPGDIETIDNDRSVGPAKNAIINFAEWQWVGYGTKAGPGGITMSDTSKLVPRAVESWKEEPQPDGTCKYTLKVRKGVKFHSGNPLTAADLQFGMLRRAGLARDWLENTQGYWFATEETCKVIDQYTLECTTQRPSRFLHIYTQRWVLDSKLVKENSAADDPWGTKFLAKNPATGGAFKVTSWTPGVEMIMEKFADWWGPKPKLDKMIWRVVPSVADRVLLLKSGEVDVALDLPVKEIKALRGTEGVKIVTVPSTNQLAIGMNSQIPPFDNLKVRQAFSYAFPYREVIDNVYAGAATDMPGPVPVGVPGYTQPTRRYTTDLDKARQLLADAGMSNLEVTLTYNAGFQTHEDVAILFQNSLNQIGVKCTLQKMPTGQFNTEANGKKLALFFYESLAWIQAPGYILNMDFVSTAHTNLWDYRNLAVDDLLARAGLLEMSDPAQANAMFKQIEGILLDEAPWIYIAQPSFNLAMRDNITGYVYQNTELHHFWLLDKK